MAQIIVGGAAEFDALAFGRPHPGTMAFLQQQTEQFTHSLSEAGRVWASRASDLYRKVDLSEALQLARAMARKVRNIWETDDIHPLTNIGQFQHARPNMQRWVMAELSTRQLYLRQGCDGYSDTYVNRFGDKVGPDHYDYRRATNELVMETPEGGWESTTYAEELLPGDRELLLDEQADIQTMWTFLRDHIRRKGDDPTSPFNASL